MWWRGARLIVDLWLALNAAEPVHSGCVRCTFQVCFLKVLCVFGACLQKLSHTSPGAVSLCLTFTGVDTQIQTLVLTKHDCVKESFKQVSHICGSLFSIRCGSNYTFSQCLSPHVVIFPQNHLFFSLKIFCILF